MGSIPPAQRIRVFPHQSRGVSYTLKNFSTPTFSSSWKKHRGHRTARSGLLLCPTRCMLVLLQVGAGSAVPDTSERLKAALAESDPFCSC